MAEDRDRYLTLDNYGQVILAGKTWSRDFPASDGAYDPVFNGQMDGFVARLNGSLTICSPRPSWAANDQDYVQSVALDNDGDIYVAGYTESRDFPTTDAAYDRGLAGVSDGCVSKLQGSGGRGVKLDLWAERRDVAAFSIASQYGQLRFTVKTFGLPVSQYHVMRRQGQGDVSCCARRSAPSELNDNQFQMQDKYLEKLSEYTYMIEAYDEAMQLLGRSADETI